LGQLNVLHRGERVGKSNLIEASGLLQAAPSGLSPAILAAAASGNGYGLANPFHRLSEASKLFGDCGAGGSSVRSGVG
jgi:hypothetical protein